MLIFYTDASEREVDSVPDALLLTMIELDHLDFPVAMKYNILFQLEQDRTGHATCLRALHIQVSLHLELEDDSSSSDMASHLLVL